MLRAPNRLDELVGNALSETGKIRLRKQIKSQMRQQQIEEELAQAERERKQSMTRRFGRTLLGRRA